MIVCDENALICDFAETYHIFDYKSLPPKTAATLAVGLSCDSRIKSKINGHKQLPKMVLLSAIADALNTLVWFESEDGAKGINRPVSFLKMITESDEEYTAYSSIEEYEAARKERMENG